MSIWENYNPSVRVRDEIQLLLEMMGLDHYLSEIQRIAAQLLDASTPEERKSSCFELTTIDKTIPGLGLHNVNEGNTGVYQIEHRPIFRGLQYVEMHLAGDPIEWLARDIVIESCYHVESSLKYRLKVEGPLSVGMILNQRSRMLDADLTSILGHLNSAIYNQAKHTIERIAETEEWDGHMFSVADAIAVYLACRKIGARLLKDQGITTKHGVPVF